MPKLSWEWKLSPHVIISLLNFVVILIGVIGVWFKMQSDIEVSRQTVQRLDMVVNAIRDTQIKAGDRITKVETKVDLMLPMIQRIETRQMMQTQSVPQHTPQTVTPYN